MLVSKSNKFIFIHVPKTAGTALTASLAPYCHPWASDSKWRGRAVRWLGPKLSSKLLVFNKHMHLSEAKDLLAKDQYEEYFKFGFLRNPFDLLVSSYFYQRMDKQNINYQLVNSFQDFGEFVHSMPHRSSFQKDFICVNEQSELDYIGNFNELNKSLREIEKRLGLSMIMGQYVNKSKHSRFSDYYDEELKTKVANLYEDDIRFYNEQFNCDAADFDQWT